MCLGRVPEGGGSYYGEGSSATSSELGSDWWTQEVGIRGAEVVGRSVLMEQVGDRVGGMVTEGFLGEEKDFELDPLWDRKPVEVLGGQG